MATQVRLRQLVARVPDPATQQALLGIVVALEGTAGVPVQTSVLRAAPSAAAEKPEKAEKAAKA